VTQDIQGVHVEPLGADQKDDVVVMEYREEHRTVRVKMAARGLLVFSEHNYPGWQATVDGAPAPLLDADGVISGVPVQAGTHMVELRFRPRSVFVGLWISVASVVVLLGVFGYCGLSRKRTEPARDERGPVVRLREQTSC
jgi:uncharacterized membrane protein YfhO